MNKFTTALSVLAIGVASSSAQATKTSAAAQDQSFNQAKNVQPQQVSGFYLGAAIGTNRLTQIRDTDLPAIDRIDRSISSSTKTSFELFGGYQFNRIIAVELAYADFGKLNYGNELQFTTLPNEYSPSAFTTQANIGYTFTSGLRPFALIGLSMLDLNPRDKSSNEQKKEPTALRTGAGIEYAPAALHGLSFIASYSNDWYKIDYKQVPPRTILSSNSYSDLGMLRRFNIGASYKF